MSLTKAETPLGKKFPLVALQGKQKVVDTSGSLTVSMGHYKTRTTSYNFL